MILLVRLKTPRGDCNFLILRWPFHWDAPKFLARGVVLRNRQAVLRVTIIDYILMYIERNNQVELKTLWLIF